MAHMTASIKPTEPLGSDADLGSSDRHGHGLIAKLEQRERVSPSVPLDAPDPSASAVYTDEEYDAVAERLEVPAALSERLRQTLSSRPQRQQWPPPASRCSTRRRRTFAAGGPNSTSGSAGTA